MREFANPSLEQNDVKNSSSVPYYSWDASGGVTVNMAVPVAESIRQEVIGAFRALPRRGLEIGGVLIGRVVRRSPLEVSVQAFEPVPCEHRFGPSFSLSDKDLAQLEQMLARSQSHAGGSVLGYFRSFTGREIELDATDQELIQQRFRDPDQLILAIQPVSFTQCVAWCFVRQDGQFPVRPTGSPFPFAEGPGAKENPQSEPEPPPRPEASETPQPEPTADPAPEVEAEPAGVAVLPDAAPKPTRSLAAPRSPSPRLESEPERAAPRRLWPWAVVLLAGLAGFAAFHRGGESTEARQLPPIGLAAQRTTNGVEVTWDGSHLARQKATGGLLAISDGTSKSRIELDETAVARGRLTYQPSGGDLLVHMSVFGPGQQWTTESLRLPGTGPSPSAPAEPEETPTTATAAAVSPEPAPQPEPEPPPPAAPEPPPAKPRPVASTSAPEPSVAAEAIHQVQPGISDAIRARLRSPVTVAISVQIDAAGKVVSAATQGGGDGLYLYLAERAKLAARFWRFRPARAKDGTPVPSTKTLFFVFRA